MNRKKIAIISSHPIQYNAPMFALLSKSKYFELKVFYTWSQSQHTLFDKDFGKKIEWDIPLLDGYEYEFAENISSDPGPHHKNGIDCPGLNTIIENWQAEAIIVYGWNYKAHIEAMKYFKGNIPIYFRGDSTLLDEKPGLKKIARRLYLKNIYKYTDFAFYVGKNNKDYFLKHGLAENQLFFAPHAIDNDRFKNKKQKFNEMAKGHIQKLKIDSSSIVVVFVGKFEPKKNPNILLDAAKKLSSDKFSFVFIGNGQLENELKQSAKDMSNVYFMPFMNQSEIPSAYYMADILALPSQGPGETWGLVVNEAMACAKAILVSDKAGCSSDLVENGKNGFVFPSGNVEKCVEYLNIMSNKDIVSKMGKYSELKITDWSFKKIVESFEKNIL